MDHLFVKFLCCFFSSLDESPMGVSGFGITMLLYYTVGLSRHSLNHPAHYRYAYAGSSGFRGSPYRASIILCSIALPCAPPATHGFPSASGDHASTGAFAVSNSMAISLPCASFQNACGLVVRMSGLSRATGDGGSSRLRLQNAQLEGLEGAWLTAIGAGGPSFQNEDCVPGVRMLSSESSSLEILDLRRFRRMRKTTKPMMTATATGTPTPIPTATGRFLEGPLD